MSLASVVQTPNPGEIVTMFRLDTSSIGGSVQYFCQAAAETSGFSFGGVYYTPVDVKFEGFETNGSGALPQPKMQLAATNGVFQAMVNTYGDLVGCSLSRVRTFKRFLDGQPDADPTAYYGPDMFRVERKSSENPTYIEWELAAAIDQENKMLPGRQVLRDTCLFRYRIWDAALNNGAGGWDYTKAQCPYTGQNGTFNTLNQAVAEPLDQCSRMLSGCKTRFGANQPLPFGGFPGVARVRM